MKMDSLPLPSRQLMRISPGWLDNAASGNQTGLVDGWKVPQTIYWLFADGKPVGYGKIRHFLTDKLLADGGTISYSIRPGQRNKGFGKILLTELIKECSDLGIKKALLTIHKTMRHPSRLP